MVDYQHESHCVHLVSETTAQGTGVGPVQRDLYSAFLAAYLDPTDPTPRVRSHAAYWEGAEARLRTAHERLAQRANEGQHLPRSMGILVPERVCPKV
jgi:hypothetical protein